MPRTWSLRSGRTPETIQSSLSLYWSSERSSDWTQVTQLVSSGSGTEGTVGVTVRRSLQVLIPWQYIQPCPVRLPAQSSGQRKERTDWEIPSTGHSSKLLGRLWPHPSGPQSPGVLAAAPLTAEASQALTPEDHTTKTPTREAHTLSAHTPPRTAQRPSGTQLQGALFSCNPCRRHPCSCVRHGNPTHLYS